MNATLITPATHQRNTLSCVYSPAEAAQRLGVSESTVRRAVRKLGVRRIAGATVTGFVRFAHHPVDVSMPYSE